MRRTTCKRPFTMNEKALTNLREYLAETLQPQELMWLINELSPYAAMPEGTLEPYTMEELNARIDEAERQIAEGKCHSSEEVFRMLDEELGLDKVEAAYKVAV